ncbi:hypothetical protein CRG98_011769, partial [Punica granatum]
MTTPTAPRSRQLGTTHTAPDLEGLQLTTPTAPRSRVLSARVPDSRSQLDPQLQISPPVCLPAEPSAPFQLAPLPSFSNRETRDFGDRLPPAQGTRQESHAIASRRPSHPDRISSP